MTAFPPPPLPAPTALRLRVAGAPRALKLTPPFGVSAWSTSEDADLVVMLKRTGPEPPTLAAIAAELPAPSTLRAGSLVLILGELEPSAAFLGRLLGIGANVRASRANRSSALLSLGYERVGGGLDGATGLDLVWGFVPESATPPAL